MADISTSLRAKADQLQQTISYKLNPSISQQRLTPRRVRIAESMREDGLQLKKIQSILYKLADLHESKAIPPSLAEIKTNAQIATVLYGPEGEAKRLLLQLVEGKELELTPEEEIRKLEQGLVGTRIPGFFPTPPALVTRMLSLVPIRSHDLVLEPSAGKGDIADSVRPLLYPENLVHVCEINHTLTEILIKKGHLHVGYDFLQYDGSSVDNSSPAQSIPNIFSRYNVILMNPPFEHGQDMDHVQHAYSLLAENGMLVSLVSSACFFRNDKKTAAFRSWLQSTRVEIHDVEARSFTNAFRSTGVNCKIIVISK